jgi:hypothetical protein
MVAYSFALLAAGLKSEQITPRVRRLFSPCHQQLLVIAQLIDFDHPDIAKLCDNELILPEMPGKVA